MQRRQQKQQSLPSHVVVPLSSSFLSRDGFTFKVSERPRPETGYIVVYPAIGSLGGLSRSGRDLRRWRRCPCCFCAVHTLCMSSIVRALHTVHYTALCEAAWRKEQHYLRVRTKPKDQENARDRIVSRLSSCQEKERETQLQNLLPAICALFLLLSSYTLGRERGTNSHARQENMLPSFFPPTV